MKWVGIKAELLLSNIILAKSQHTSSASGAVNRLRYFSTVNNTAYIKYLNFIQPIMNKNIYYYTLMLFFKSTVTNV